MEIVKHYKSGLSSPLGPPRELVAKCLPAHHWLSTFWLGVVSSRWWFCWQRQKHEFHFALVEFEVARDMNMDVSRYSWTF